MRFLRKALALFVPALALGMPIAAAQEIPFRAPLNSAALHDAAQRDTMPALARTILSLKPTDPETLFRVQMAAGDYPAAEATLHALIASRAKDPSPLVRARDVPYAIYTRAKIASAADAEKFDQAYAKQFRSTMAALDNRTAALIVNDLSFDNSSEAKRTLDGDLEKQKGKSTISAAGAEQLLRDDADAQMYSAIAAGIPALLAEDDARRYDIAKDIQVQTPDHAIVCTLVVRPRNAAKLPALLEFTIYNGAGVLREARRAASNGYAGVIGLTRGKGCSSGPIEPYEHDGADADALIEWIARQPWSDGRAGMYGGSYSGFTPWAAAKHRPAALKAIAAGAPAGPGINIPMEGNIVWNFVYPWPFYTTDNKTLDNATYNDKVRWQNLNRNWYVSGRAYRDLDKIDGKPNPIFDRCCNTKTTMPTGKGLSRIATSSPRSASRC